MSGQAFPGERKQGAEMGMTLLEWYAGQVLQGMLSRAAFNQDAEDMMKKAGITPDHVEGFMASLAFDFARAMVSEAEKWKAKA